MPEDKMSPERITQAPVTKPTARRHWSAVEINEIRKELSGEFDKLSRIQSPNKNGFTKRTSDFVKEASVQLESDVIELDHPSDLGLGLAEPAPKLPKVPQVKP